jgi:hypothetical protein
MGEDQQERPQMPGFRRTRLDVLEREPPILQTKPDAAAELMRLRAQMVRLAHEVEGLTDCNRIASVRAMAPPLARRMRDAAMAPSAVEASR